MYFCVVLTNFLVLKLYLDPRMAHPSTPVQFDFATLMAAMGGLYGPLLSGLPFYLVRWFCGGILFTGFFCMMDTICPILYLEVR